jgi:hypothetical protein
MPRAKRVKHAVTKRQRQQPPSLKGIISPRPHGGCELTIELRLPQGNLACPLTEPTDGRRVQGSFRHAKGVWGLGQGKA